MFTRDPLPSMMNLPEDVYKRPPAQHDESTYLKMFTRDPLPSMMNEYECTIYLPEYVYNRSPARACTGF